LNPDDELRASEVEILSGFYLKPFSIEILQEIIRNMPNASSTLQ